MSYLYNVPEFPPHDIVLARGGAGRYALVGLSARTWIADPASGRPLRPASDAERRVVLQLIDTDRLDQGEPKWLPCTDGTWEIVCRVGPCLPSATSDEEWLAPAGPAVSGSTPVRRRVIAPGRTLYGKTLRGSRRTDADGNLVPGRHLFAVIDQHAAVAEAVVFGRRCGVLVAAVVGDGRVGAAELARFLRAHLPAATGSLRVKVELMARLPCGITGKPLRKSSGGSGPPDHPSNGTSTRRARPHWRHPMTEPTYGVVVGARCAGAPTAMLRLRP